MSHHSFQVVAWSWIMISIVSLSSNLQPGLESTHLANLPLFHHWSSSFQILLNCFLFPLKTTPFTIWVSNLPLIPMLVGMTWILFLNSIGERNKKYPLSLDHDIASIWDMMSLLELLLHSYHVQFLIVLFSSNCLLFSWLLRQLYNISLAFCHWLKNGYPQKFCYHIIEIPV